MDFFSSLERLPKDPIFGLNAVFREDPRKDKKSLITGYFVQENGKVPLLQSVFEAEKLVVCQKKPREYLPIEGDVTLTEELGRCAFGSCWDSHYVAKIQALGGTGSLYLIAQLVRAITNTILILTPTWVNHQALFRGAGLDVVLGVYYQEHEVAFDAIKQTLLSLKAGAAVLMQTSCHNPTGMDLSHPQWDEVIGICKENKLFLVFDMAYQGFSEDLEEESYPLRKGVELGISFAVGYTVSKNFSLYGERVGASFFFHRNRQEIEAILSHLRHIARITYSNPPTHGMSIVKEILTSSSLRQLWFEELAFMRQRIHTSRLQFVSLLAKQDPKRHWEWLNRARGLFCYSGLSPQGVLFLRKEKGFYIAEDGRINVTALHREILPSFVDGFLQAMMQ